jgi:hypothetical protein
MSNDKQTAVEWLGNEITNRITRRNPHDTIIIQILGETLIELIEQAKEMENKQIEDAELRSKEIIIIKHTEHEGGNK